MNFWRFALVLALLPPAAWAESSTLTPAQTASSNQAVATALANLNLTPVQAVSVRDYIGQGKANITGMEMNNVNILILRDPQSNAYLGEVVLKPDTDGGVFISKVTGAEFDAKHEVKVPALDQDSEEAEQVISGAESAATFEKDEEAAPPEGPTYTVPAVSAEASLQYGAVKESYASFAPDGHGYEYGLSTNIGQVGAGGQLGVSGGTADGSGFAGLNGEIGAESTKVEVFVNYLGAPVQDENGNYTRTVLGGSYEMHGTLANAEAKIGCFEGQGCTAQTSWGLLGIGAGAALNYAPDVTMAVVPEVVEADTGVAAPPPGDDAAQPDQTQPDQSQADQPDQTQPDQSQADQPDQTQPDQSQADQPDQTQPDQSQADQPDQTQPDQSQADQPDQTQPDQSQADQPDQTQPDQSQADQPDQTQPDQSQADQPDQTQPDQSQADQPDQTQPDQSQADQPDQTQPDQSQADQPDQTQPAYSQPDQTPDQSDSSYTPPPDDSAPEPSYTPPPEDSAPEPSYSPPPEESAPPPPPPSDGDD
jgi:hypothetical protein